MQPEVMGDPGGTLYRGEIIDWSACHLRPAEAAKAGPVRDPPGRGGRRNDVLEEGERFV